MLNALTHARFCALLILFEIAFLAFSLVRAPAWDAFLIGDCPCYAATAALLVEGEAWDLSKRFHVDLDPHDGCFALAADQRIVPKHSVLMPILSAPFVAVFGRPGLLGFNLVQMFALLYGLMRLAGGGNVARLLILVGYLSTPLLAYTYNYSPDVLGTALLVWSYVCAVERRQILCGLFAGLAIWAKVYLAIVLLPLALLLLPWGWKPTLVCAIAAAAAVAPMLFIQWQLFGSPFITGYDRDARLMENGVFSIADHYSRFHQSPLVGLGNLLVDRRIGLFWTAPLWFFWPLGVWVAWRSERSHRAMMSAAALALVLNLLFFAFYDEWHASALGNRFLFPALAFGLVLQRPFWERLVERRGSQPAATP